MEKKMDQRQRVLIVDDEPEICELLKTVLDDAELDIDVATNGMAAAQMAGSKNYAVIICDVRLPLIGGEALIGRFLSHDPQKRIVMMSAYATPEMEELCLKLGARKFLKKPFRDLQEVKRLADGLLAEAAGLENNAARVRVS